MYKVSEQYKEAMKRPVQRFRMTGTIGTTPFYDKNILQGSMSITNQCSDNNEVKIGQVYIGELNVTLVGMNLPRYSLKGRTIKPVYGLMLSNLSYEDVPLGVFYVSEAEWTASGVVIKAYDAMSKLDKSCNVNSMMGMPYAIAKACCDACGVELATSDIEFSKFSNGSEVLSMMTENDIDTWRDMLSWIAQSVGCNAMADRDGRIIFRPYGQDVVDTITPEQRFQGGSFSDFETRYTGLACVNIAEKTTSYYGMENDDGLTYNLGQNPFLQYGVSDAQAAQRRAVLDALQMVDYVPFKVSMIGNPAYDLMDVFSFPDGIGDADKLFCMTKYTFTYHGKYEAQGVGKNPALGNAKSKTDKDISGLLSQNQDEGMHYNVFTNPEELTVSDGESKSVASVTFAVQKNTHVHIEFEFLLTAETTETGDDYNWTENDAVVTVTYYLNGEEITTHYPVETWQDGKHVLHLMYDLQAVAAQIHTWDIWMSMVGGSIHFDQFGILGVLSGVGLAGDSEWDGNISAGDDIHAIRFYPMFREFADKAILKGDIPLSSKPNETLNRLNFMGMFGGFTDSVNAAGTVMIFTPYVNADRSISDCTVDEKTGWIGSGTIKLGNSASMVTSPMTGVTGVTASSSNAVFYASFDNGETWKGWTTEGWVENASMIRSDIEKITPAQWKQGGDSVRIKVYLEDNASMYSLNVYGGKVG